MKITQDVRDYAARLELEAGDAIEAGLAEKSAEFRERGGKVYVAEPVSEMTTGD